jgi:hypothetical protein
MPNGAQVHAFLLTKTLYCGIDRYLMGDAAHRARLAAQNWAEVANPTYHIKKR